MPYEKNNYSQTKNPNASPIGKKFGLFASGMNDYNGLPKTYFSRHHHTHSFHTKNSSS